MDINVTFRHTEPIESLKTYAEEKIAKLDKYLDSPAEAHIVLTVEKFRHQADVTLSVNGARIKAFEETEDMYSAIDQVMDKVEIQLKRHLSKIRDRRSDGTRQESLGVEGDSDTASVVEEEPIIEVEKLEAKPMDPEEAAMQLGFHNREFMVFRNAKTNEINVLYRKNNGNLGLIEPI